MSGNRKEKIKSIPRWVINIALLLVIILLIAIRNNIAGKEYFYIAYAPFSATVRIGDKYYKNNAYNYIEPGEYDLIVELDHFETVIDHIVVPNEFNSSYGALESIDDEGDRIAAAAIKDYQQVGKGSASESSPTLGYEIEQYLPIQNALYKISSNLTAEEDNSLSHSINIEAGDVYVDTAVKKLFSFLDKDPAISAYDIRITNYENPFAEAGTAAFDEDAAAYITNAYSSIILDGEYKFADTIKSGRYMGVVMCTQKDTGGVQYKTSRVVLKRDGENWEILNAPYPVITKFMVPEVQTTFLNRINLVNCGA